MAKKAAAAAKQRSIMSFFGAGSPPKKRKPVEDDVQEPPESPVQPMKKAKVEKETLEEETTVEENEEQVEDEPEDIEMEEEEVESKTKPGRRRLRQRVVEDEDDDSDLDLPMNTQKKAANDDVIDMTSPVSTPEKDKSPKKKKTKPVAPMKTPKQSKNIMKKSAGPAKKEKNAGEHGKFTEVDEVEEIQEVDEVEEVKPKKEVKKSEVKKDAALPTASKTGFFTPVSSKKSKAKSTQADDKKDEKVKGDPQPETTGKKKFDVSEKQDEGSDEPRETPYFALAHLFSKIEEVTGRLVIQDLLTTFFRGIIRRSPDDLLACIYLCVCVDLAPPFENLKIGIGDAILMKAIGEATGANLKFIKEMYHKEGDLGKVAQNARSKQKTLSFTSLKPATSKGSGLTVQHVYNQFVKIAKMTGNNSQQQKCSIIKGLLVKCEKEKKAQDKSAQSAEGAKYIIRGLQGKLRIGLAEKSILMGLTYAFMTDKDYKDKDKQQEALAFVKKAFAECPSYNALIAAFYEVQKEVPSAPFLRVKDFAKVAEKCVLTPGKPFTCEYKYDGERAQIHILANGEIAIFSRNFENSTERFPDVKLAISNAAKEGIVKSCIVDAEVVAVDRATNKRLPFQILSTRSRKNVKVEDIKVP
ncbi:DNA ligase, partial [Phytophthora palmivora]